MENQIIVVLLILITNCVAETFDVSAYQEANGFTNEEYERISRLAAEEETLISDAVEHHISPCHSQQCTCPDFKEFINPSFELSEVGWALTGLTFPEEPQIQVASAGFKLWFFRNAPTDGSLGIIHSFDGAGPESFILQTVNPISVPSCGKNEYVTLKFDYRLGYNLYHWGAILDRIFKVQVLDACDLSIVLQQDIIFVMQAGTINLDTGILTGSVDLTSFIFENIVIKFEWVVPEYFTGPASTTLDNLRIVNDVNDEICTHTRDCKCRENCKGKKCSAATGGGWRCQGTSVCCCEEQEDQCEADQVIFSVDTEQYIQSKHDKAYVNDDEISINSVESNGENAINTKATTKSYVFWAIISVVGVLLILCVGIAVFLYYRCKRVANSEEMKVVQKMKEIDDKSISAKTSASTEIVTDI